jgi:hypothetical protein
MLARILGWLAGFAAGFMATLVAGVIVLPTTGPVRTLMLVAGSLAGLAVRRRRARPARIMERPARRTAVRWRWRGDGLGA